jgi:hypothetical protein
LYTRINTSTYISLTLTLIIEMAEEMGISMERFEVVYSITNIYICMYVNIIYIHLHMFIYIYIYQYCRDG